MYAIAQQMVQSGHGVDKNGDDDDDDEEDENEKLNGSSSRLPLDPSMFSDPAFISTIEAAAEFAGAGVGVGVADVVVRRPVLEGGSSGSGSNVKAGVQHRQDSTLTPSSVGSDTPNTSPKVFSVL